MTEITLSVARAGDLCGEGLVWDASIRPSWRGVINRFSARSFDGAAALDLPLARPPGAPSVRLDDGRRDPEGRFWLGSMANDVGPDGVSLDVIDRRGAPFRLDASALVQKRSGSGVANTPRRSPGFLVRRHAAQSDQRGLSGVLGAGDGATGELGA